MGKHNRNIFNCVKSDKFNVGDVPNDDAIVVRTDEVCYCMSLINWQWTRHVALTK